MEKHPIFISNKCCEEKHVDLLLIEEKKAHYVPIKDFNTPCVTTLYTLE